MCQWEWAFPRDLGDFVENRFCVDKPSTNVVIYSYVDDVRITLISAFVGFCPGSSGFGGLCYVHGASDAMYGGPPPVFHLPHKFFAGKE